MNNLSEGLKAFNEYNSSYVYRHSGRINSMVNLSDNEESRDLCEVRINAGLQEVQLLLSQAPYMDVAF